MSFHWSSGNVTTVIIRFFLFLFESRHKSTIPKAKQHPIRVARINPKPNGCMQTIEFASSFDTFLVLPIITDGSSSPLSSSTREVRLRVRNGRTWWGSLEKSPENSERKACERGPSEFLGRGYLWQNRCPKREVSGCSRRHKLSFHQRNCPVLFASADVYHVEVQHIWLSEINTHGLLEWQVSYATKLTRHWPLGSLISILIWHRKKTTGRSANLNTCVSRPAIRSER